MKRFFRVFIFSLGLASCAELTAQKAPLQEEGRVLFVDDLFSFSFLERKGMAVLPMSTRSFPQGIRNNVIYEVQQALGIYLPKLSLITKSEILDRAKNVGLEKQIRKEINLYEQGGKLNHDFLKQIRPLTKTRYFLYLRIREFKSFYQGEMISKKVALEAEIWDAQCMKVVWSGEGKVDVVERVESEKIRLEDVFIKAARALVAQIRLGENRSVAMEKCAS